MDWHTLAPWIHGSETHLHRNPLINLIFSSLSQLHDFTQLLPLMHQKLCHCAFVLSDNFALFVVLL